VWQGDNLGGGEFANRVTIGHNSNLVASVSRHDAMTRNASCRDQS
jgi:hypothetical protein